MSVQRLLAFVERLREAHGAAQLVAALSVVLGAEGFHSFTYLGLPGGEAKQAHPVHLSDGVLTLTTVSPEWQEAYQRKRHNLADPVLRASMGSLLPVVWGPDFAADKRSAAEDAMMADARAHGIEYGVTVTVHSNRGGIGMLSAYAAQPVEPANSVKVHAFHLTAVHFHQAAQDRLAGAASEPVHLTQREIDVLNWTAEGKTAWAIGQILDISERTVNAHLRTAMRKMGVFSKTHAVAKFLTGTV